MDHFEQTPGTDHGQGESDEALLQKMEQEQEQLSAEGLAELQSDEENDQ